MFLKYDLLTKIFKIITIFLVILILDNALNRYFAGKVEAIWVVTASAQPPTLNHRDIPPYPAFIRSTVEGVSRIMRDTPSRQCELDSIPTWLVKELCDVLTLIVIAMTNASFAQGHFHDSQKHAIVRPRLNKILRLDWHEVLPTNLKPQLRIENRRGSCKR